MHKKLRSYRFHLPSGCLPFHNPRAAYLESLAYAGCAQESIFLNVFDRQHAGKPPWKDGRVFWTVAVYSQHAFCQPGDTLLTHSSDKR